MIVRAIFWISAMALLMPAENQKNYDGEAAVARTAVSAAGQLAQSNILSGIQELALETLRDLREERFAQRHHEVASAPQGTVADGKSF